jgi:tripartite-type tricarboxylate transporter receptor subunit TctC
MIPHCAPLHAGYFGSALADVRGRWPVSGVQIRTAKARVRVAGRGRHASHQANDIRCAVDRRDDRRRTASFRAIARAILQGQVDRLRDRLSDRRQQRRLCARGRPSHRQTHPGKPDAGSFLAINQVYAVAPKDGTVIGIGAPTATLDEKLGSQGVRYKTAELNWLGRVDSLVNIVFTSKTSPVKTFADAQKYEATLAGTGAGSTVSIYPTVMNNVLGTKFKLIMGYRGSNEAMLAIERGEVDGHSTAWTALKVAHPDWVRDKTVSIFAQFAIKRHRELADVPTAVELARNDEERHVLSAIMAAAEIGTAFFTTPGVPPDRLNVLRRAFDETMQDKEFLDEAHKTGLTVGPMKGEDLQKLVADTSNLQPDLLEKVRAAYPSGAN